jgi:CRISPR type III-A-associated RAMP protein Csm5
MNADTRRFVVEVLTPVHVGSGVLLPSTEVPYDKSDDRSYVLDLDAALDALGPESFRSDRIPDPEGLLSELRNRGVPLDAVCWESVGGRFAARDLRLCVRDGCGRPLLPGSSTKGALRTALLVGLGWDHCADRRSGRGDAAVAEVLGRLPDGPKFAARRLEKALLRPDRARDGRDQLDPHDDPLRVLSVTDAAFDARCAVVEYARVSSPAGKKLDSLKDYKIGVEALAAGSKAECSLRLDGFLGREHAERLGFDAAGISWQSLAGRSRDQARRLVRLDLAHYQAIGLDEPARALEDLVSTIDGAPEGSIVLRIGWGIGWAGTTGALASPDERHRLIRKYGPKLSRHSLDAYPADRPFPKSRKVVGREAPQGVFGWVVLRPAGDGERVPPPEPPPVYRAPRSELSITPRDDSARTPARSPGDLIVQELTTFKPHELAGRVRDFYDRVLRSCTDQDDRRKALTAIRDRMKDAGLLKKWKDKPWIVELMKALS